MSYPAPGAFQQARGSSVGLSMPSLPGFDADWLNALVRLEGMRTLAATSNPSAHTAANVAALARTYPGMSPGVTYALGASGYGPSDIAQRVWQAELATTLGREPGTTRVPRRRRKPALGDVVPLSNRELRELSSDDFDAYEKAQGRLVSHLANKVFRPALGDRDVLSEREFTQLAKEHADLFSRVDKAGREELFAVYAQPNDDGGLLGRAVENVGDTLGFVAGERRTPLGAAALEVVPFATQAVGAVQDVAKPVVRGSTIGLMGLAEAPTGWARQDFGLNLERAHTAGPQSILHAVEQTTAYQAIRTGDTGSGYLPSLSSEAMKAQAEAARKYSPYLIGGHAWTPGRAMANLVFEPDDDAFNIASGLVDATVAMKADPASLGLKAAANLRATSKLLVADELVEAGAIRGHRKLFSPKRFSAWMQSEKGSRVLTKIAEETNPRTIHEATGLPYYLSDDVPIVAKLAAAESPDDVADLLRPYVGTDVRQVVPFRARLVPRSLQAVPGRALPTGMDADLNVAARNADLALVNARATEAERDFVAAKWADAGKRPQRYAAVDATFDTLGVILKRAGLSDEAVDEVTTWNKTEWREVTNYGDDAMGQPLTGPSLLKVDDTNHVVPHPIFAHQFLNAEVPLPDFRAVRRAVSGFAPALNNKVVAGSIAVADLAMVPWRKLMLMRPAWGVRVIAEEQARIAALGFNALYHHPLTFMAWVIGNPDSRWINRLEEWENVHTAAGRANQEAQALRAAGEEVPGDLATRAEGAHGLSRRARAAKERVGRGTRTLTGESFDSFPAYLDSQYGRFSALWDENPKITLKEWGLVPRGDQHYPLALAEEVARIRTDALGRGIISAESPRAARDAFWDGTLAGVRDYMGADPRLAPILTDRLAADELVDVASKRIGVVTADNPSLVEAMQTGRINGVKITDGYGRVTEEALEQFKALSASGAVLPRQMRIQRWHQLAQTDQQKQVAMLRRTVDWAFEALMPRPSNFLSRSPFARQAYWRRAEELMPYMDADARTTTIASALEAHLDDAAVARLREIDTRLTQVGDEALPPMLNAEHANDIAMRYALDQTKNLLYDLSERSQFFDAARLIFPFGEAWKEILTRWAKITVERPQVFRRGTQVILAARQEGSNAINEALGSGSDSELLAQVLGPTGTGGFFHRNEFGEEVFTYPGSQLLTKALIGIPVPLSGQVQGLNLIGQGLPGVGPVVQIPVTWFLPDKPEWDDLAHMIAPYGLRDTNPVAAAAKSFLPLWAEKVFRAVFSGPESDQLHMATVMGVADHLASTGEYDLQGPNAPAEMARLLDDAKSKAPALELVRGLGQATLPASPSPEWLVYDKKGRLLLAWRAAQWYYDRLEQTRDPSEAFNDFLDRFGVDNFLLVQAKSDATIAGADRLMSVAGSKWARANPDLREKYPNVYGLFAPDSEEFDSAAYQRQIQRGEREQLTPEEMVMAANARLANIVYSRALDDIGPGPDDDERAYLRALKAELERDFPGYNDKPIDYTETDRRIAELKEAVSDPKLRRTDAGRALKTYLAKREQAIASQHEGGLTAQGVSKAQSAAPIRLWLSEWGEYLADEHPRFAPMWTLVFEREVARST